MTGALLKPGVVVAYGAPAVAFAILLLPPYVFLPGFYTQTLGLPLDVYLARLRDLGLGSLPACPATSWSSARTRSRSSRAPISLT